MRIFETGRDDSPDDTSIHAGQRGRQGRRRTLDLPIFRTRDASPLSSTRIHDLHLSSDPNVAEPDERMRMRPKMSPRWRMRLDRRGASAE